MEIPARFVSPALDCGVVVVPVATKHLANRRVALGNFSTLAKYEQRTAAQIGIAIAKVGADVLIDWFYLESPWANDEKIEAALRGDPYPFRRMSASALPRYQFEAHDLRRSGLVRDET